MFTLVSTTQIFSSSAKLLLVNLLAFGASLSVLQSFISWDSARVDIWLDMYHRELWNLGDSYFFLGLRIHCSCSSCSSQFSKIKGIEKSTFFSFRTRFDTIWFRCSVFLVSYTSRNLHNRWYMPFVPSTIWYRFCQWSFLSVAKWTMLIPHLMYLCHRYFIYFYRLSRVSRNK